jgi:hypothetical protein
MWLPPTIQLKTKSEVTQFDGDLKKRQAGEFTFYFLNAKIKLKQKK